MIKNHKFLSLFAITLIAALLLSLSSRATSVYAMADPVIQELAPVFDTQIYQLSDYVQQLPQDNLDIFYALSGAMIAAQLGMNKYEVADPFTTKDGVIGWFKSLGLTMYNTLTGLGLGYDPQTGIDLRPYISIYVAHAMGDAVTAATYQSWSQWMDDIENLDHLYMPFGPELQLGVNTLFAINDGAYKWQQFNKTIGDAQNVTWNTQGVSENTIASFLAYVGERGVRWNKHAPSSSHIISAIFGDIAQDKFLRDYQNLFINTYQHKVYVCKNDGTQMTVNGYPKPIAFYSTRDGARYDATYWFGIATINGISYPSSITTVKGVVDYYFSIVNTSQTTDAVPMFEDFIQHIYVGVDWAGREEVQLTDDLNLEYNNIPYYLAFQNDVLIDILGVINDLLNTTDLHDPIINNVYDNDFDIVMDPVLIQVATDIRDILIQDNPQLPVNLNEIFDLTQNDYLELVKEHGENFGETIGEYVAFWHNADPEITYVKFGALILTLLGAFIGKWGHS